MHRGARRAPIFRDDEDCLLFLQGLEEAVDHHGLEVHAYALMPNHFHLLVRSPLGNLSKAMKHVMATFTLRVNRRHQWDGPVFRGRFRSQLVSDDRYLDSVFTYVHLNPIRAGLVKRLEDTRWSSLRAYLGREQAPVWLRTEVFRARLGGPIGIAAATRSMRKQPEKWPEDFDRDTGWIRAPAEAEVAPRAKAAAPDRPRSMAEVLGAVARVCEVSVPELKRPQMGPRANPARRIAVWALSRERIYSHGDIGKTLGMSEGQVAKVLWRFRQERPPEPLSRWMSALGAK